MLENGEHSISGSRSDQVANRYCKEYKYIPNSMLLPGLEHASNLSFTEGKDIISVSWLGLRCFSYKKKKTSVFTVQQGSHYIVIKKKDKDSENPKCSKLQLGSCMYVLIIIHR